MKSTTRAKCCSALRKGSASGQGMLGNASAYSLSSFNCAGSRSPPSPAPWRKRGVALVRGCSTFSCLRLANQTDLVDLDAKPRKEARSDVSKRADCFAR